jgi:plastocyanin
VLKRLLHLRRLRALLALTVLLAAVSSVAVAATRTVLIKNFAFNPKTLTISRGSSVTWKWQGYFNHNVAVKSGPVKFRSRIQYKGAFSHTFLRAGTYHLYCTLHPSMKETVVVR